MSTLTNLAELVEPLKREVAAPGGFDAAYPDADDDIMFAYLADAFGQAQLDYHLKANSVDLVTGVFDTPLTLGEGALVTIYAALRIFTTQILNSATKSTYKAGPVEYSTAASDRVLTAAIQQLETRLERLLTSGYTSPMWVADGYWGRIMYDYNQPNYWYDSHGYGHGG